VSQAVYHRVKEIFLDAVELRAEERAAFVAAAACGDAVVEARVKALLRHHEEEDGAEADESAHHALVQAALARRYTVKHAVGSGGMATVYRAHDVKHGRDVAIKVLHPRLARQLGWQRFLSEIEITAKLHHPHILPLHDSGEADGVLYYVMPYVEGESLRATLRRERRLPVGQAVTVATSVALALDYAHRHDVIHRDIKPENILFQDRQPLVADFGIALAIHAAAPARLTVPGTTLARRCT
jgi:serine/threonine-protein kinase